VRKTFALIGALSVLLPLAAGTAAAKEGLFEQVSRMVLEEQRIPDDVAAFAAHAFNAWAAANDPGLTPLTPEDVRAVLESLAPPHPLCAKLGINYSGRCQSAYDAIRKIAERETATLRLGRRLQVTATHYEEPISSFSVQPSELSAAYLEVLQVWGIPLNASSTSLPQLRLLSLGNDEETMMLLQSLDGTLQSLPREEQRTAAVWRYQYGLSFVEQKSAATDPDRQSGPGTERQYLFARPPDVERSLRDLRNAVVRKVDPPLLAGEIAMALLPLRENVFAWAYVRDGSKDVPGEDALPLQDVGLRWDTALNPVLPSLLADENTAIVGGTYPPPPVRSPEGDALAAGGSGLCDSLSGRQGFLCSTRTRRTMGTGSCLEPPPPPKDNTIILSPCSPPSSSTGANALRDICKQLRSSSSASSAQPCQPGGEASYPYTVIGHACFVRECAERTYGHTVIPKRDPLVAQEDTSPWDHCREPDPEPEPLKIPAAAALPVFPAYNPEARAKELLLQYCQSRGRPPTLPPVLCQTSPSASLALTNVMAAFTGLSLTREWDTHAQEEYLEAAEAQGLDRGTTLEREYLRLVSAAINGTLRTTVDVLRQMAMNTFPTAMCPLNPQEDLMVCSQ
jgi:hypothetical protein